jgi:DNA/RNA-binding domain of Phe-tRNA-synthetase-like protein
MLARGGPVRRRKIRRALQLHGATQFERAFPGAHVGVLLLEDVSNAERSAALEARLQQVQAELRRRFAGVDRAGLQALPSIAAYLPHYRAFGQTYHVLRQLESVALKGKPLGSPSTLISAMFAAELMSQLLTAGHDADCVVGDLLVDCSREGDRFLGINGQEREIRPGDMLMRDAQGIISAVLYGPDERTRLRASTTRALFVTYAPAGISMSELQQHLERIAAYVKIAEPNTRIAAQMVVPSA